MNTSEDSSDSCFIPEHHFSLVIPPVSQWNAFHYMWIISGAFTVVATVMALYLTVVHLRHYARPELQRYVVRILLMVPIYSIDSWFSFRLHWWGIYFDTIRDCYEAFVIHNFFVLLMNMLGGYDKTKDLFENYPAITLPPPLCFWKTRTKRGLMGHCRRLVLQYVIIRPITTLVAAILQSQSLYCYGMILAFNRGYIYITLINFFSVTCAVYGLVLFYIVASDALQAYHPLFKFFAIKFVLFLTFWQGLVIEVFVYFKVIKSSPGWTVDDISDGIQNCLLCTEMLIAAIINFKAFTVQEYQPEKGWVNTHPFVAFLDTANPMDMIRDIKYSFRKKNKAERRSLLDDVDKNGIPSYSSSSQLANSQVSSSQL